MKSLTLKAAGAIIYGWHIESEGGYVSVQNAGEIGGQVYGARLIVYTEWYVEAYEIYRLYIVMIVIYNLC